VAAATAAQTRDLKIESFATVVHGAGNGGLTPEAAARATMESSIPALYR
jgi:leucyl aminopeptidase